MDEQALPDGRCLRGRRSRVGLTPRRWRQIGEIFSPMTGARKPDPRGEHEGNRKTIAQGMPDDGVVPVVTNSCAFLLAREAAGARRTRHSLRPLCLEDVTGPATRVRFAPRECEALPSFRTTRSGDPESRDSGSGANAPSRNDDGGTSSLTLAMTSELLFDRFIRDDAPTPVSCVPGAMRRASAASPNRDPCQRKRWAPALRRIISRCAASGARNHACFP
jgi:hypothetical protein